jgi:hypothetical protein
VRWARAQDASGATVQGGAARGTDELLLRHQELAEQVAALVESAPLSPRLAARVRRLCLEQQRLHEEVGERLRAHERVTDTIDRLNEHSAVSEVVRYGPVEAAVAAELDRVLLTRLDDGQLIAEAVYLADGLGQPDVMLEELRRSPVTLEYPLLECELLRRRCAQLVDDVGADEVSRYAFAESLGWASYIAAPIVVEGRVAGFFHGDRRRDRRRPTPKDMDSLDHFASGFAQAYERAVLRRRLRDQRHAIKQIATWAEMRASESSEGGSDLHAGAGDAEPLDIPVPGVGGTNGHEMLTRRELEVLRIMGKARRTQRSRGRSSCRKVRSSSMSRTSCGRRERRIGPTRRHATCDTCSATTTAARASRRTARADTAHRAMRGTRPPGLSREAAADERTATQARWRRGDPASSAPATRSKSSWLGVTGKEPRSRHT